MNKKIEWMSVFKAIACIAIIMIHVTTQWISIPGIKILPDRYLFLNVVLQPFIRYAVSGFILISGALLLNPQRKVTIEKLLNYIKKMIIIIIVFQLLYNFVETIYMDKGTLLEILKNTFYNIIYNNGWVHMWYIYMLIGLYVVTPLLREFTIHSDKKTARITLLFLGILTILIPTINNMFDLRITSLFFEPLKYITIYLLGHYLVNTNYIPDKLIYYGGFISVILYEISIAIYRCESQTTIFLVFIAMLIIKLLSKFNVKSNIVFNTISKYGLGIFLIHPIWLNITYKVLKLYPGILPIGIGELCFCIITTILSLITCMILYKIPIIKKIFE